MVQREVIEQELLGGLPADEEPVPQELEDINPLFDFSGFGQAAQQQFLADAQEQEPGQAEDNDVHANDAAQHWGLWPP